MLNGGPRSADSGSQGPKQGFKKRNAGKVANAHGRVKLQIRKKGGDPDQELMVGCLDFRVFPMAKRPATIENPCFSIAHTPSGIEAIEVKISLV